MIEQYFVVDDSTPLFISNPSRLDERVKSFMGADAYIARHSQKTDPVDRYEISGNDFSASADVHPSGWDVHTPFGSGRRLVRVVFSDGDYEVRYGGVIETLGLFDGVLTELQALYNVDARILPLFNLDRNVAAILIDNKYLTPFKVDLLGRNTTFPAYGIVLKNSRQMPMFRRALRTSSPLAQLLTTEFHRVH